MVLTGAGRGDCGMNQDIAERLASAGEAAGVDLPKLHPCRLVVEPTRFPLSERASLESRISDLESRLPGWVRRQSAAVICPAGEQPAEAGAPLSGEWCDGDVSYRLDFRQSEWSLLEIRESGGDDGQPVLRQSAELLAERADDYRKLVYDIYWSAEDAGVARRVAARFRGFASHGEGA